MRWLVAFLAVPLVGCTLPWQDSPGDPVIPTGGATPPPEARTISFGGTVTDVVDDRGVEGAEVRLSLGQVRPCRREGIVWSSWSTAADAEGRFGPLVVPVPRSGDVAFFLYVTAPAYSPDVRFFGPQEARGDTGNVSVVLHPEASVAGTAPPGTLVALEWPDFPRLAVAGENGTFVFENAHVTPMQLVADTSPPRREVVQAPTTIDILAGNGTAWRVEGFTRLESGAPTAADVVAWDGDALVGVARSGETGFFVLPLAAAPADLRIEARTGDGRHGGSKVLELAGPPASRENVILRALC